MSLPKLSVRRGVTFSMFYLIIAGFGLFSLTQLKLALFPRIRFPVVAIVNSYTGVGPLEIENLVTRPLEMAIASVKNVSKIRSTSKHGTSLIIVELEWGTDIDQAMIDIREKIDIFKNTLPEDARQPFMFAFDPSLQPILLFGISGPGDQVKLRRLVERRIAPLIERIGGVASAQVLGGDKREIQVLLNPHKLRALGVSVLQVVQALRMDNIQVASGSLNQGRRELALRTVGTFQSLEEIGSVVVGFRGRPIPQPIYLSQVAEIRDGYREKSRIIRALGKDGMLLMVQKRSDANTVQTARRVLASLPDIEQQLPPGVSLQILFNQSDFIEKSLANLNRSALQAFFLAVLVLFLFLRSVRSSLIIAISIPISVIATFAVMFLSDTTLNVISMAGLALAVGMLVDNSIVVLENIFRHHQELNREADSAAIEGANEVVMAITASTLTTLAVFIPILFVPGLAGLLFRDMVITITFSLSVSLVVAITLIPLMASRLFRFTTRRQKLREKKSEGTILKNLKNYYKKSLIWSLNHRKMTLFIGFLLFIGSLALVPLLETEFIPKADDGMIILNYELSPGTALKETIRVGTQIEEIVRRRFGPMLEAVEVEAGIGEGFIALFGKGSHAGLMRIRLKPLRDRALSKFEIQEELRRELGNIPGLKFSFQGGRAMFGGSDIEIHLFGHDLERARELSQRIKNSIKGLPGIAEVKTSLEKGRPELQIRLRREKMRKLGLNAAAVGTTISTAFKGTVASLYRDGGDEYKIMVRLQERFRQRVENLKNLLVTTPRGKAVPLHSIAEIHYSLTPVKIERQDQQRVTTIFITLKTRNMGRAIEMIREKLDNEINLPDDFYYKIGGQAEDFISSFKWLGAAFFASILLVYMVMASQFESLFEPFVILFSIPLSVVGAVLGLFLTGSSLSVMAFIGVIMLVGIVVNNAIVLIDFIKQSIQKEGLELLEACVRGGEVRLRPILMTALTTIFGMVPLALGIGEGAESWSGLGRVVIGGMLTSTFLTLYIVPVLFTSMTLFFRKISKKLWTDR